MDEKIEEMKEIIAKAISDYLEEEGIIQLHIKGKKDGTSTKIISNALYTIGYRKEIDTAREILKWLVGNKHLFNRTHEIGFEKPRTSYLIMSDEIEELAEKYGVDLVE
jgi:hypothetical protein